jgi:hypothetical protein
MALRQNFSVSSGMSEVSISWSGRPASFARRRLRAAFSGLSEKLFLAIFVISLALLLNRFPVTRGLGFIPLEADHLLTTITPQL